MTDKKSGRHFLLPFMVVGFCLAALTLLLPLLPQKGMQKRLQKELSKTLQRPCRVAALRLKLWPRPALAMSGVVCRDSELNLKVNALDLDLSLLSLCSFSPQVKAVRLRGVVAEMPFPLLYSENSGEDKIEPLLQGIKQALGEARNEAQTSIYLNEAVCKMTAVPGFKSPLIFSKIEGIGRVQTENQSESFTVSGELNGGSCSLKVTCYKVETAALGEKVAAVTKRDSGDRVEVTCRLNGVSFSEPEALALGSLENLWRVDFAKGDLELDINGNPEGGLRFAGKMAVHDHHLSRLAATSYADRLWSQGPLKATFSGFFQRRDGYLNIKNIFLDYPESATLFSRGLLRFREPFFVNLVNHLKVDDLSRAMQCSPLLSLPGYKCAGSLEGELNLVGNPFSAPVLKLELNSEKIVLRALDPALLSSGKVAVANNDKVDVRSENRHGDQDDKSQETSQLSDWRDEAENFLHKVATWNLIVKSDCRIKSLDFSGVHLNDFVLVAEKNLLQLEVERLAARLGSKGQARLSLIVDNLIDEPHWHASLVAEKLDLKPFKKNLEFAGVLDASLVGGGRLGVGSEPGEDLTLQGKWKLRQGVFLKQPLFVAFKKFLEREGRLSQGADFSNFSSEFSLRDNVLRLDNFKISFSGKQLQARGRLFVDSEKFNFKGRYWGKDIANLPFHLSGETDAPKFILN